MMSVMPFFDPSTTPVCRLVNSSAQGIGVGEAPSAYTVVRHEAWLKRRNIVP